jgi:spermidine/putrescine transport system permease protein
MARLFTRTAVPIYVCLLVVFLYLPVASVMIASFNESLYSEVEGFSFSFVWYRQIWQDAAMRAAFNYSVLLAGFVAMLSTALGLLVCELVLTLPRQLRLICAALLIYPIFFPSIVQATSFSLAMFHLGIERSFWTVALGQTTLCLPLAVLALITQISHRRKTALDAARDLGDTQFWAFMRVTVPMRLPHVTSSLAFTFVLSFNEWEMAYFLSNTRETLPLHIWNRMEFPDTNRTLMALSNMVLFGSLLFLIVGRHFLETFGVSALKIQKTRAPDVRIERHFETLRRH